MTVAQQIPYLREGRENVLVIGTGITRVAMTVVKVRGASMNEARISLWHQVERWRGLAPENGGYRNSYVALVPELGGDGEPSTIAVLCKGEAYGRLGYVAQERVGDIRALSTLTRVHIRRLDCTVTDYGEIGKGEVTIAISAPMPIDLAEVYSRGPQTIERSSG